MARQTNVAFLCVRHPHCEGRANAVKALPNTDCVGMFDPNQSAASEFAAKFDCPLFSSAEDLLSSACDLVIVEGTNLQCAEYGIQALDAGKWTLIEKPGANNLDNLRRVVQASENKFCQIGYHLRYSPSITEALRKVKEIGRITTARFHAAVMNPWLTNEWFCDSDDMGGMVFLDFCHMLDLLTLFLGSCTSQKSIVRKLKNVPEHIFEDSAAFALEFGDILAAGDCCGWEANDWITTWDIELYGMDGTLKLGIHPPWIKHYVNSQWKESATPDFDGELNYHYEIADIAERISSGAPPGGCSPKQALHVAEVISKMYDDASRAG